MDNILSAEESTISSQDSLKYGYLYVTTNLINNKKYIGVHKSSTFDENYKGSGKLLWRAINKYGWENFSTEIIKWCYSKEELFESEYGEIKNRNAVISEEYYNVMEGGHGGDNKSCLTPEEYNTYIQKLRDVKKNRPLTEKELENCRRLKELNAGKVHSEKSRLKSSISNRGQKRSEQSKLHMSQNHADVSGEKNPMYGKTHTEETRRKMSESAYRREKRVGWKHSDEAIEKMRKAHSNISDETREKLKKNHVGAKNKIWITNKLDDEQLVSYEDLNNYPGYVRGRLRKRQKDALKNKVQRLSREGVGLNNEFEMDDIRKDEDIV